jgi:hypothetical protein
MNRKPRKLKLAATAIVLACALAPLVTHVTAGPGSPDTSKLLKEIDGYKGWTKVNDVPQLMPHKVAAACAAIVTLNRGVMIDGSGNPHRDKYFTVYVNEVGREAMLRQKAPIFPEGSVIVKEKLPAKDSDTPELLTVMIKRKSGFNPATGDWEYAVVDGGGTVVEERGNLQNCQACHIANRTTDYIFRTYLSDELKGWLN